MIEINNLTNFVVDKKFFTGVAKKVLKGENRERENVSIAFVSPQEIQMLNKRYRKKDVPTDVLSFEKVSDFKDESSEVIICPHYVREHATESTLSLKKELAKIKEPIKNNLETEFYLNIDTGDFRYHKINNVLSPKSREFRFLKTLYSAPDHQATYKELSGNPETVSKNDKIMLTETIKIVKRKLGILPKNKFSNPDMVKNISKYGYKLDI